MSLLKELILKYEQNKANLKKLAVEQDNTKAAILHQLLVEGVRTPKGSSFSLEEPGFTFSATTTLVGTTSSKPNSMEILSELIAQNKVKVNDADFIIKRTIDVPNLRTLIETNKVEPFLADLLLDVSYSTMLKTSIK